MNSRIWKLSLGSEKSKSAPVRAEAFRYQSFPPLSAGLRCQASLRNDPSSLAPAAELPDRYLFRAHDISAPALRPPSEVQAYLFRIKIGRSNKDVFNPKGSIEHAGHHERR